MDITLYIPCYNAEKTIPDAIESALAQTYPVKELIVVNDGSTDKSKRIIDTYPVTLVNIAKNKGSGGARNQALKHVKSDFVAALDSDCLPQKDWLENLVTVFERNSLSRVAGVGGKLIEENINFVANKWRSFAMRQHWGDDMCVPSYLLGSNTLFATKALHDAGLYDRVYRTGYEDVDICERLKKVGYSFIYNPNAVVIHRKRDTVSSVLKTHWDHQFHSRLKSGSYENISNLKDQIYSNFSYAISLINTIILKGKDEDLLYPSLLSFFSHSFQDLKAFIDRHQNIVDKEDMLLILRVRYCEIFDLSMEWFQQEFYVEEWVMKRVRADLIHTKPTHAGLAGKVNIENYKDDREVKRFIEFFYTKVSKYLSSLNKVVFDDMWRMMERQCLR